MGSMLAYGCVKIQSGYAPERPSAPPGSPGSNPSFNALLWSVTPISPCSKNATQSAWCSRRGSDTGTLCPGGTAAFALATRPPSVSNHQLCSLHSAELALRVVCPSGANDATAATASARLSVYSMGGYATSPSTPRTMSAVPEVPSTAMDPTRARVVSESWSRRDQSAPRQASAQPPVGTPSPPMPPSTMGGYFALVSATASPRASTATQRAPLVPKLGRGTAVRRGRRRRGGGIAVAPRRAAPLAASRGRGGC